MEMHIVLVMVINFFIALINIIKEKILIGVILLLKCLGTFTKL